MQTIEVSDQERQPGTESVWKVWYYSTSLAEEAKSENPPSAPWSNAPHSIRLDWLPQALTSLSTLKLAKFLGEPGIREIRPKRSGTIHDQASAWVTKPALVGLSNAMTPISGGSLGFPQTMCAGQRAPVSLSFT
jgi:hypothetical protein